METKSEEEEKPGREKRAFVHCARSSGAGVELSRCVQRELEEMVDKRATPAVCMYVQCATCPPGDNGKYWERISEHSC